ALRVTNCDARLRPTHYLTHIGDLQAETNGTTGASLSTLFIVLAAASSTAAQSVIEKEETIVFHRGDVGWILASSGYVSENTTDRPFRNLIVDLKGTPSGSTPYMDSSLVSARIRTRDQNRMQSYVLPL